VPVYSAKLDSGFSITLNGEPLTIALLTPDGAIAAKGGQVAAKLFNLAVETHEQFWISRGQLKQLKGGSR
jgi:hypothetical protein